MNASEICKFCYLEFENNSELEAHYSFVHRINQNSLRMNLSQELIHISSVNEGKKLIGENHAEEKSKKSKIVIEKAMLNYETKSRTYLKEHIEALLASEYFNSTEVSTMYFLICW